MYQYPKVSRLAQEFNELCAGRKSLIRVNKNTITVIDTANETELVSLTVDAHNIEITSCSYPEALSGDGYVSFSKDWLKKLIENRSEIDLSASLEEQSWNAFARQFEPGVKLKSYKQQRPQKTVPSTKTSYTPRNINSSHANELADIKVRIKSLAKDYASSQKGSETSKKIMAKLESLRKKRNMLRPAREQPIFYEHHPLEQRHEYCDRCNNQGMGVHRNIERGRCFKCGRLPVKASKMPWS